MLNLTSKQRQKLRNIAEAIQVTNYGKEWPPEYSELFRLWGFFNSIYNALYTVRGNKGKIKKFAVDSRFSQIWDVLGVQQAARKLALQPCVGDGRSNYDPDEEVQEAFHILRTSFAIKVEDVCQSHKCNVRQQICFAKFSPDIPQASLNSEDAKFTSFKAALLIV